MARRDRSVLWSVLLGLFVLAGVAEAGGVTMELTVPESVAAGGTFDAVLQVRAGSQTIDGAEAHLSFNPAIIQVQRIVMGNTLNMILANKHDNEAGTAMIAAGKLSPFASGTIKVATVTFRAVAAGDPKLRFVEKAPVRNLVTFGGKSVLGGTEDPRLTVR